MIVRPSAPPSSCSCSCCGYALWLWLPAGYLWAETGNRGAGWVLVLVLGAESS
jgi:hypothetical protein